MCSFIWTCSVKRKPFAQRGVQHLRAGLIDKVLPQIAAARLRSAQFGQRNVGKRRGIQVLQLTHVVAAYIRIHAGNGIGPVIGVGRVAVTDIGR